jgi:GT2 family glycosyltransferase
MPYQVSVCICTRNRSEELKKALDSLKRSTYPVFEVIVSDDSTSSDTQTLIHSCYPNVKYLVGPHRGLGANRNNALTAVTGSHVLFIDDDAILGEQFLETVFDYLESFITREGDDANKIIVTGIENNNGSLVFPHEQNFLGHQKIEYIEDHLLKTVVINSAVFPRNLFNNVLFDKKLVYGCDEVDFTTRAVKNGYKVILCSMAVNLHFPSVKNRDFYEPYHEASRVYVTFKRYFTTEKKRLKAIAYLSVALPHALTHLLKREGLKGFFKIFQTLHTVASYIVREYLTEPNRQKQLS